MESERTLGGVGVGRNFMRSRSRKEFYVESESEGIIGGVGVVEMESEGTLGGVGRNFRWSRSRKELQVESESEGILGGVEVGRNFRWS
jgi:hypothetical protein